MDYIICFRAKEGDNGVVLNGALDDLLGAAAGTERTVLAAGQYMKKWKRWLVVGTASLRIFSFKRAISAENQVL
jgi:hypothetical protein